jgi:hypothetical protein
MSLQRSLNVFVFALLALVPFVLIDSANSVPTLVKTTPAFTAVTSILPSSCYFLFACP